MQSGSVCSLSKQILRLCSSSTGYGSGGLRSLTGPVCAAVSSSHFQQSQSLLLLGGVRFKFSKKPSNKVASKDPEGIQYHGFTYFPRHPDQKDPPIEPSKLFMVRRIRSLYGCPIWEKKWIQELKLEERRSVAIVKNTPENNKKLYRVKHLVEIIPITVPYGMPDSPENAFLKENGEFVAYNLLSQHGITLEEAEKLTEEEKKTTMDKVTLKNRLHNRWYSRYDVI